MSNQYQPANSFACAEPDCTSCAYGRPIQATANDPALYHTVSGQAVSSPISYTQTQSSFGGNQPQYQPSAPPPTSITHKQSNRYAQREQSHSSLQMSGGPLQYGSRAYTDPRTQYVPPTPPSHDNTNVGSRFNTVRFQPQNTNDEICRLLARLLELVGDREAPVITRSLGNGGVEVIVRIQPTHE